VFGDPWVRGEFLGVRGPDPDGESPVPIIAEAGVVVPRDVAVEERGVGAVGEAAGDAAEGDVPDLVTCRS
jgi:hypothetical protein